MHRVTAQGETTSLADRKRRAGQCMIIGLSGPSVSQEERALIRELRPAGFILFSRNIEEAAQVRELNRELATLVPNTHPALLSVDYEGGRVQRLREGVTRFPPMRWVGNCRDLATTARVARALSAEVRALGFNLNWAPDADVDSNPRNPVIGDRSFGRRPDEVGAHVAAWIQAAHAEGLIACAKHFPGHGDTDQDSHHELPKVEKELPDLLETELRPFEAAIKAGVGAIMTAHVVFPEFDEDYPATMSAAILRGQLRERMGYEGVVVSDDMEMKAVRGRFPLEQQLALACGAGVDMFLFCKEPSLQHEGFEELVRLQEQDRAQHAASEDSERRIDALRERFLLNAPPAPELAILDSPAHRELVNWVRARGEEA